MATLIVMLTTVLYAVCVALWASFLLLLAYKTGLVEWMQVNGGKYMSQMAHCNFCMSWWLCVIMTVFLFTFTEDIHCVCVPFLATPIARMMV